MSGNPGTFCTMNYIALGGGDMRDSVDPHSAYSISNGSTGGSYYPDVVMGNMEIPKSGEWYFEYLSNDEYYSGAGIQPINHFRENSGTDTSRYREGGYLTKQEREYFEDDSYLGQWTANDGNNMSNDDVLAYYINDGVVKLYHEGHLVVTFTKAMTHSDNIKKQYFPTTVSDGNYTASSAVIMNFGQDSTFNNYKTSGSGNYSDANGYGDFYYQPPGNALALCKANLPLADAFDLAQDGHTNQHFDVISYTGNGGTQAISGLNFQPDLVWIKATTGGTDHALFDSTRGVTKRLRPSGSAAAEDTISGVTAFNSDGFTLGSHADCNDNSDTFVAMCWKVGGGTTVNNTDGTITGGSTVQANQTAGFSIVKWTSDNTNGRTVGHGLSEAPEFIISKPYSASTWSWHVFHYYKGSVGKFNFQNSPLGGHSAGTSTYGANPTATVFNVGNTGNLHPNNTTTDVISYCWHSVEGFSKFGYYIGSDGSGDHGNAFIHCGFKPKFIFVKRASGSSTTYGWINFIQYNDEVQFNDTGGQSVGNFWIDQSVVMSDNYDVHITSNGFKFGGTNVNHSNSGEEYIFGAWADLPQKYANAT